MSARNEQFAEVMERVNEVGLGAEELYEVILGADREDALDALRFLLRQLAWMDEELGWAGILALHAPSKFALTQEHIRALARQRLFEASRAELDNGAAS